MPALYTHTTRASGIVLTAAIYNADHENHVTNGVPAQLDDYSANATEMRLNTDPGEVGTESLPTTLAGELERIRFAIKEMKTPLNGGVAVAQWYTTASGSVSGTVADGSITMAKLADLAGLSIIGRSANTTGVPAAITGTDGQVLRVSGTTLGFGNIVSTAITGLGTAATKNTGTSGNTIPLLNADATWSAKTGHAITSSAPTTPDSSLNVTATVQKITTNSMVINGIANGVDGRMVTLYFTGTGTHTLEHETTASASNRIRCPSSIDLSVRQYGGVTLIYDGTLSRWVIIGASD